MLVSFGECRSVDTVRSTRTMGSLGVGVYAPKFRDGRGVIWGIIRMGSCARQCGSIYLISRLSFNLTSRLSFNTTVFHTVLSARPVLKSVCQFWLKTWAAPGNKILSLPVRYGACRPSRLSVSPAREGRRASLAGDMGDMRGSVPWGAKAPRISALPVPSE